MRRSTGGDDTWCQRGSNSWSKRSAWRGPYGLSGRRLVACRQRIDVGLSDHRRVLATLSMADDALTTDRLLAGLAELTRASSSFDPSSHVDVPPPDQMELETVQLPRDAFFGPKKSVKTGEAVGPGTGAW